MNHLLFTCSVSKIVWATIATCLGASDIPLNTSQSWSWCEKNGSQMAKKNYVLGIAAIYWAIWKTRNKACFDENYWITQLRLYVKLVCSWNSRQASKVMKTRNCLFKASMICSRPQSSCWPIPPLAPSGCSCFRMQTKMKMLNKTRRFEVAKLRILLADRCWSSCFLVSLGSNLVVLM